MKAATLTAKKPRANWTSTFLVTLFIGVFTPSLFATIWSNSFDKATAFNVCSLFTIGGMGYFLFSWKRLGEELFMPQPIFLVSVYVYHFGQFVIVALGLRLGQIGSDNTLYSFRFTLETLHDAQMIAWAMICFLQVGGLLAMRKGSMANFTLPFAPVTIRRSKPVFAVGLAMALVGFVPAMLELFQALTFRAAGTLASFTASHQQAGVADVNAVIGQAFLPGLLFMLAGASGRRWVVNTISVICAIWFVLYAAVGDRSTGILPLIALAWLVNLTYRKIQWKYLYTGIAVLALVVNPIVTLTRNASGLASMTPEKVQSIYLGEDNPALTFLNEAGCSVIPLADTLELVPGQRPYGLGLGYVQNMVISPFSFLYGSGIQIGYGSNAYWLIKERYPSRLAKSAFLGFSSVAEAYIEYGYLAPLVGLVIGYVLTRSAYLALRSRDATLLGAQGIFLLSLIHFARGDSGELGRPLLRYIMLPIFVMYAIEKVMVTEKHPAIDPSTGGRS